MAEVSADAIDSTPSANVERVASSLLPTVFAHTESRRELRVLDLGVGIGQSIDVISVSRPCHFFFADIGRHVGSSYDGSAPGLLPFIVPRDIKFDICFFWDYLNLMNERAFRQFAEEIDDFLDERTLIHGFLAADVRVPMPYRRYKLASNDTFERIDYNNYTARYPKTRRDFEECFPRLHCENVVLFPGNRQELLAAVTMRR